MDYPNRKKQERQSENEHPIRCGFGIDVYAAKQTPVL